MRLPPPISRCCAAQSLSSPPPLVGLVTPCLKTEFLLPAASSAWLVADWYAENKFYSPYYTESHVEFAAKVRAFVDAEIRPNVLKWYAPRSLLLTHDDDTRPV